MTRQAVTEPSCQDKKKKPDAVRADILRVATKEFATYGLSGARVNVIAANTQTSKRMIYYYFENKENLYLQVLEAAYKEMRQSELKLKLTGLLPEQALRRLVEFTFDHHRKNLDFIRLVMIENIHQGEFLKQSNIIHELNLSAITVLESICKRGMADGSFRKDIVPLELHLQISALCFHNVSNQPTFSTIFGKACFTQKGQRSLRESTVQMILQSVKSRAYALTAR